MIGKALSMSSVRHKSKSLMLILSQHWYSLCWGPSSQIHLVPNFYQQGGYPYTSFVLPRQISNVRRIRPRLETISTVGTPSHYIKDEKIQYIQFGYVSSFRVRSRKQYVLMMVWHCKGQSRRKWEFFSTSVIEGILTSNLIGKGGFWCKDNLGLKAWEGLWSCHGCFPNKLCIRPTGGYDLQGMLPPFLCCEPWP